MTDESNFFVKLYRPVYQDPVWNGKVPGQAWRVYSWMIDRTTKEHETKAGTFGLVFNKAPVTYSAIATNLGCSWRSVQRAVLWLRKNRLIHAVRLGTGQEYRYVVLNSRKFGNSDPPETATDQAQGNSFEDENEEVGNLPPGTDVVSFEDEMGSS